MSVKDKAAAIDRFVRTIKASGAYDDIGTACIMAGWTNLAGALTPLKGAAPTNGGGLFQNADLDPGIGLKGNGSSKYLNANRANNADGQDDNHNSVYVSAVPTANTYRMFISAGPDGVQGVNTMYLDYVSGNSLTTSNRYKTNRSALAGEGVTAGFKGVSRPDAAYFQVRSSGSTTQTATPSTTPTSDSVHVFDRGPTPPHFPSDATLSWYSIGSATDLAALDSAVSTLMADLRAIDEAGFDRDAVRYIRNVEAADGSYLETGVKQAINSFIVGLKKDNLFDAIKASCILCGARTISGALVPLVGASPTPYNFAGGDYDRATGLKGDGSTKYLDSNRANDADGQDDNHIAVYATQGTVLSNDYFIGATNATTPSLAYTTFGFAMFNRSSSFAQSGVPTSTGLYGTTRASPGGFDWKKAGASGTAAINSVASAGLPTNNFVFCFSDQNGAASNHTDARLAFYSIGSAIPDLAALDNRVSTLVSAIAAAI